MPRFVYFDLGNVLVTFDHEIAVAQLAHIAGCSTAATRCAVFESSLQNRFETGLVDGAGFAAEVNRRLGTELRHSDVLAAVSDMFQPNPTILSALEKLRSAQIPLGILSNTCQAHWDWLYAQDWPMLDGQWFEHAVLSYEVQSMKPDTRIYEICEKRSGCIGSQIFFTDDRPENVAAAARRGWNTYRFGTVEGLLDSIEQWLGTSALLN